MADTVLTELKIHDFDTLEQMSQYESEIGNNDIVFTPDMSAKLFLFKHAWADYLVSDMSWLRADTFSWHSGETYEAAYEHLRSDFSNSQGLEYIKTDTIGDIEITYYQADDGHKICTPDQESNLVALYEATGVAWYYLLDTENKQFKLPRTKYGFTGLRDSVGGYVEPGAPNITGAFHADNAGFGNNAATGAFRTDTSTTANVRSTGNNSCFPRVYFDASLSSSVYGNSTTVQPPATQMYLYFYVGNFGQEAVEQTAGITTETLNGKADAGFGNVLDSAKELMANASMPSGAYTSLTLGADGSKYTAPADGWFVLNKRATGAQYLQLMSNGVGIGIPGVNNQDSIVCLPVKKGSVVTVYYNYGGATNWFRFMYAEGAKHLA